MKRILYNSAEFFAQLFFATRIHEFYLIWQIPLSAIALFGLVSAIVSNWNHPEFFKSATTLPPNTHFHLTALGPIGWFIFLAGCVQFTAALIALILPEMEFTETSVYGAGHYMQATSSRFKTGTKKNLLASLHLAFGSIVLALLIAGTQFEPVQSQTQSQPSTLQAGDIATVTVTQKLRASTEYKVANQCVVDGNGVLGCDLMLQVLNANNRKSLENRAIRVSVGGLTVNTATENVQKALESGLRPGEVRKVALDWDLRGGKEQKR